MKVVVTGVTGKVGSFLVDFFQKKGLEVMAVDRRVMDLAQPDEVEKVLRGLEFDTLVNVAAMAGIEQCEAEPELAMRVNAESPAAMARVCAERRARMLHLSTDYVLDGREEGLKAEGAATFTDGANGAYGQTKLAGELGVAEAFPEAGICRVSWVFGSEGSGGQGFLETIIERARAIQDGESLEGIADKISSPTYVGDLAEWLVFLLKRESCEGLWHLTNPSSCGGESWHSYAEKTVELAHELGILSRRVEVSPRYQRDGNIFKVLRPVHTGMEPKRLMMERGLILRNWEDSAKGYLSSSRLIS